MRAVRFRAARLTLVVPFLSDRPPDAFVDVFRLDLGVWDFAFFITCWISSALVIDRQFSTPSFLAQVPNWRRLARPNADAFGSVDKINA